MWYGTRVDHHLQNFRESRAVGFEVLYVKMLVIVEVVASFLGQHLPVWSHSFVFTLKTQRLGMEIQA